ncbi:hypothetical protein [Myxococcus sp. CA039A]|uniref:hypothetical protein n=1 Tax=Myxococcus sp. CA039A TaxID=2741737 RepID=UPI00157A9DF3|nr:hypothetical protein [Myxococcus sp. CA039A]NTX58387.1 hypothetical protein [Myxococcus sp. CA039A]
MKKTCLLLLLSTVACTDSSIRTETPCSSESTRVEEANQKVREATTWSNRAHESDPSSADAERAHAAVMAALTEQTAAKKSLASCKVQQSQP